MMTTNLVLAAGVAYGLLGALILFLSHRSIHRAATSLVAGYPRVIEKLRVQRCDGRFGLAVLACGVVLQILAAGGYGAPLTLWRYPASIAGAALLIYGLWRVLASRRVTVARTTQAPAQARVDKRVFETRRSSRLREAALAEAPRLYALERSLERRLGADGAIALAA